MRKDGQFTRRSFMRKSVVGAATAFALPTFISSKAFGANDRINMGFIGMGGQGRGDMGGFLNFDEVRAMVVCDVVDEHMNQARNQVNSKYGNQDCATTKDWREVVARDDLDAIFIGTPDHWHAIMSVAAMKAGKDVYCEKPETLTVSEGRAMADTVKRYSRVFSGGSQRVWEDYDWLHKMVQSGQIGQVQEVWVNIGNPSGLCHLKPQPTPAGVDWDMWLGPAPWRPFDQSLIKGGFRGYRDYSGGQTTDWGCHVFGGAMFTCGLEKEGPVEVLNPVDTGREGNTYIFKNGIKIHHRGGWGGQLTYKGTEGEIGRTGDKSGRRIPAPNIHIPNYKGQGGIFGDFVHCVRTREEPFRDIESAHRTASVCHLGNISYWLGRSLKWDPAREQIIGDDEANRWLDRTKREPWSV